mgnify:CR=1 FL=1
MRCWLRVCSACRTLRLGLVGALGIERASSDRLPMPAKFLLLEARVATPQGQPDR